MPNDLAHVIDCARRAIALSGNSAARMPARGNPSIKDLMSRNNALARLNCQLTMALAAAESTSISSDAMTANLTPRQREVMRLVLAGYPSKNIAADLHISQRTVENHRAAIMRRTGAASLPALVRLSLGVE